MIMKTLLSAIVALSALTAVALPANATPDPRNPAVDIPVQAPG
jgi:hypothetical protein